MLGRRKQTEEPADTTPATAEPSPEEQRAAGRPTVTPRKGRPTPRRSEAAPVRARGPMTAPPQTRREAYRKIREENKARRTDTRQRMVDGDEAVLGKRDRGPVRRLVRDLVDSRRSPLTLFLPLFAVYYASLLPFVPPVAERLVASLVLGVLLLMIFESVTLGRLIAKTVPSRLPDNEDKPRGYVTYGLLRAMLPRRIRTPKARVRPNAKV